MGLYARVYGTIITCYIPYDNGTALNLSEFRSCLQVAYELLVFFVSLNHSVLIIGDINSDLLRKKRFDVILLNYLKNNNLITLSMSFDSNNFSFISGDYKAKLDHCFTSNTNHEFRLSKIDYIENDINFSDHKPLLIISKWNKYKRHQLVNKTVSCNKIINLPPNFNNTELKYRYNQIIMENMSNYVYQVSTENNKQTNIDNIYFQLTSSITSAYIFCSRTVSVNNLRKNKIWFKKELRCLKSKIVNLRIISNKTSNDLLSLKQLKYKFKKIMKKNME